MNSTTNESKPVQLTNLEAIEKILDGEKGIFELIIRRNNASLYKVGRAYGYNHQDTEDLMQETYLEAYLHLSQLKNAAALKTWLIRIMLNKCNYRKMKFSYKNEYPSENLLHETSVPMFSSHRSDSAAIVANNELKNVIEAALQKISTDHRMVFSLREINGLNVAETAEVLNITEGNVKVRLNRAKAMLRTEVEKMYLPEDLYEFDLKYCDKMVQRVMMSLR